MSELPPPISTGIMQAPPEDLGESVGTTHTAKQELVSGKPCPFFLLNNVWASRREHSRYRALSFAPPFHLFAAGRQCPHIQPSHSTPALGRRSSLVSLVVVEFPAFNIAASHSFFILISCRPHVNWVRRKRNCVVVFLIFRSPHSGYFDREIYIGTCSM